MQQLLNKASNNNNALSSRLQLWFNTHDCPTPPRPLFCCSTLAGAALAALLIRVRRASTVPSYVLRGPIHIRLAAQSVNSTRPCSRPVPCAPWPSSCLISRSDCSSERAPRGGQKKGSSRRTPGTKTQTGIRSPIRLGSPSAHFTYVYLSMTPALASACLPCIPNGF